MATDDALGPPTGCGHDAPPVSPPICDHLRDCREAWLAYYQCFTGVGFNHLLLCGECADKHDAGRLPRTSMVCEACHDFATGEIGDPVGVRGNPEVLERPVDLGFDLTRSTPSGLSAPLMDLSYATSRGWFGLCADGSIVLFADDWQHASQVAEVVLPVEPDHEPWSGHALRHRLHVSMNGDFAAVVNDYGERGLVVDLATGRPTMELNGRSYHANTVPFAVAFAVFRGRDVVVHRTAWNRLDVHDALTAELLTERERATFEHGDGPPEHYLEYFHGRLLLSPDGTKLLDDGWVWHPVGMPEVWDLERWLSGNVWESEDGPTKRSLAGRDYYWDHGMCWIDSHRVAIEGIGSDDDHMVNGARLFDIDTLADSATTRWPWAKEIRLFAGPAGDFFSDGHRLFSSTEGGLSVWDIDTGARIGHVPDFAPKHHGPPSGELVELHDEQVVVWSYAPPE